MLGITTLMLCSILVQKHVHSYQDDFTLRWYVNTAMGPGFSQKVNSAIFAVTTLMSCTNLVHFCVGFYGDRQKSPPPPTIVLPFKIFFFHQDFFFHHCQIFFRLIFLIFFFSTKIFFSPLSNFF